jgi:hypothetical protein
MRLTWGLLGVETPSTCATNSLPNLRRAECDSTTHNKSDNILYKHIFIGESTTTFMITAYPRSASSKMGSKLTSVEG